MGTSSGFIGVFKSVADTMGGGLATYGAIMGASILGGLFESVLGFFIKPLRKFFPAVVTGTVVLSIGLSLISVGINSFGGGSGAKDFGSMENLLLAIFVLVVILTVKHWTNGMASNSAILIGIIAGYIAAFVMSLFFRQRESRRRSRVHESMGPELGQSRPGKLDQHSGISSGEAGVVPCHRADPHHVYS